MKIEMDMYQEIHQRHLAGKTQRKIAREMRISRQMVKKYHKDDTMPGVRKYYSRTSQIITDEVVAFALSCFEEDKRENLKKQKHNQRVPSNARQRYASGCVKTPNYLVILNCLSLF